MTSLVIIFNFQNLDCIRFQINTCHSFLIKNPYEHQISSRRIFECEINYLSCMELPVFRRLSTHSISDINLFRKHFSVQFIQLLVIPLLLKIERQRTYLVFKSPMKIVSATIIRNRRTHRITGFIDGCKRIIY